MPLLDNVGIARQVRECSDAKMKRKANGWMLFKKYAIDPQIAYTSASRRHTFADTVDEINNIVQPKRTPTISVVVRSMIFYPQNLSKNDSLSFSRP